MISNLGIDFTEKLPYEQYECNIFRANYYLLNMDVQTTLKRFMPAILDK